MAASGARDKLKVIQQLCNDGGEPVPTSVVKVIGLSKKNRGKKPQYWEPGRY